MAALIAPRIVISGVAEGVGKSLITMGLCQELRRKGVSVACAVAGPSLGQAILLRRICGRYVHVFDERILDSDQILRSARQLSVGCDLMLIEGRSSLYDTDTPGTLRGSDAELAALLQAPVALVVDARGVGGSLGAMLKGYLEQAGGLQMSGILLNRIASGPGARSRAFYQAVLDAAQLPANAIAAIPELSQLSARFPRLPPTQEGSLPTLARQFLVDVGAMVREYVDVERLMDEARRAPEIQLPDGDSAPLGRRCRIAVAEDSCFGICFQDNLDLLRQYGAEIVTFSPLADAGLPKRVGAVYLPGACLSNYAQDLAANTAMLAEIKAFADGGGVVYAEGAGAAYVCSTYRMKGSDQAVTGAGVLPEHAVGESRKFAYTEAATCEESILGRAGISLRGISTGEWRVPRESRVVSTLRVSGAAANVESEGWSPGAQILITFNLLHFGSNPDVAKNLVDNAEVVQSIGS